MGVTKKIIAGLSIAAISTLSSVLLLESPALDSLSNKLTNGLYKEKAVHSDIVIVGIDNASLLPPSEGGLGSFSDWPYSYYATAISKLQAAGAESVFIDVIFENKSSQIHMSEIAKEAQSAKDFSELGQNIASYLLENPQDTAFKEALNEDVYLLKYAQEYLGIENGLYHVAQEALSNEYFSESSSNAFSDVPNISLDETWYKSPAAYLVNGQIEETMSTKLARDYLYPNDSSVGQLSADHNYYLFDEERQIPVEDGLYYVNYSAPSYSFPQISFVDLVTGELSSELVDGKIVLIGPTAAILQDRQFTPIDSQTAMPRIEIKANSIQTILDGEFLQKQSMAGFIVLTFMLVAIAVAASMYLPIVWGSAVVALELIAFPIYAQWAFNNGTIPNLIWPVFAVVLAYFATLTYRNFTEFREKRQLTKAFGQYVSPELVAHIQANPDQLKLGGERREITALFLDIENFTTLSESLEPSEVVRVINTYFDALAKVIMGNEGTVDKYEGDAIMALFGAPVMIENHALKACRAAMAIRSKVLELNQVTGQNLNVRVGLATGPAIVGNMGSADRFDYTAMGDTVNTASRLEGANKFYGTRILVNPGTMQAAQTQILFRRVDRVRLKGKTEALDIYEVMGPMESVSEQGKAVVNTWHQALEYYRNQDWLNAESRIQQVQQVMPGDGPSQAYLERISGLKAQPPQGWDGTWTWKTKG